MDDTKQDTTKMPTEVEKKDHILVDEEGQRQVYVTLDEQDFDSDKDVYDLVV